MNLASQKKTVSLVFCLLFQLIFLFSTHADGLDGAGALLGSGLLLFFLVTNIFLTLIMLLSLKLESKSSLVCLIIGIIALLFTLLMIFIPDSNSFSILSWAIKNYTKLESTDVLGVFVSLTTILNLILSGTCILKYMESD